MVTKIKEVIEVLHRIRVKLYPNYLPKTEGTYLARTANEAVLSVNDMCAALKHCGGFTGNYDVLTENVKQFFDETAYQLCDGFAVSTGYFSIHPNIGGTFGSVKENTIIKSIQLPSGFAPARKGGFLSLPAHLRLE